MGEYVEHRLSCLSSATHLREKNRFDATLRQRGRLVGQDRLLAAGEQFAEVQFSYAVQGKSRKTSFCSADFFGSVLSTYAHFVLGYT